MALTAEQKISKSHVFIMTSKEWQWIGSVAMMGKINFVDASHKVSTAATNGLDITYNKNFIESLDQEEVNCVVLHENIHKMLRHLFVNKQIFKENAELVNIAADVVCNNHYLIGKDKVKLPKGGVDMPEYNDTAKWSTRLIYEDLKKREANGEQFSQGHDTHDIESAGEYGQEEQEKIAKDIDTALRQAAMAGDILGGIPRSVSSILETPVDWRTLLSEFVKSMTSGKDKQTWIRPNKSYLPYDLYMPSLYSTSVGKLGIFVDTSGSIGNRELSLFLGHIQSLCDEVSPDGVDIIWWESIVAGVDELSKQQLHSVAEHTKPVGCGGTNPSCVPAYIKKNQKEYVCGIVITDGCFSESDIGDWGDLPLIWLVLNSTDNFCKINNGQVVHIKDIA